MRFSALRAMPALLLLALAASMLFATSAQATNYGDFTGTTVEYQTVFDQNGLFGAGAAPGDPGWPVVSGDSLDFNPFNFEAECTVAACNPGSILIDDTLQFDIQANAGSFIQEIVFNESGDLFLGTFGTNTAGATVAASVFVDIYDINGVGQNVVGSEQLMTFTQNGEYESYDEGSGAHLWSGSLSIDVDQMIIDAGLSGQATRVHVTLDNTLFVFAEGGATSRIEKKNIGGLSITVIPEPGTAILLGLGLTGLAAVRKRGTQMS